MNGTYVTYNYPSKMTERFQETQDDGHTKKCSSNLSSKDENTAEVRLAINKNCIIYFVGIGMRDICKHLFASKYIEDYTHR